VEGYPVDARHVYLLGFSQGAVMSFATALAHPELVAGVVALSGYVPTGPEVTIQRERVRSVAFFVGHGVYDEIIPIEHGRAAQRFLTDLRVDVVYREYPMGHQISLDELEDVAAWLAHCLDRGG
jgi:phospholipase/carboxylesterase